MARLGRDRLFLAAAVTLGAVVAAGLLAGWIAPYGPTAVDARAIFRGPTLAHPFGTDRFGRDVLSRILFGVRASLGIAGASIAIAVVVGSALGLLAGWGRRADQALGRLMDVFFAFPPIVLAIAVAAVLGAGVGTAVVAIAVVYAPLFFRVVRGAVLTECAQPYVEAAEA
ncbi:MAG TPA: ABC transporter permease, partial [Methylomirabilota bacterium]|nr:ABC transporter permease [Methylomirabilota bacterium]